MPWPGSGGEGGRLLSLLSESSLSGCLGLGGVLRLGWVGS